MGLWAFGLSFLEGLVAVLGLLCGLFRLSSAFVAAALVWMHGPLATLWSLEDD